MAGEAGAAWTVREVPPEEFGRLAEIDLSESGEIVYKLVDGEWQVVPWNWERPPELLDAWDERIEVVRAALAPGGVAVGAFAGGRLVGFAALRYALEGDVAQLAALWVSAPWRRHGIATALVDELERRARARGARRMYVSATPSESAQGFYRGRGFRPTSFVHRELYALEPEDVHMIRDL